MWATETEAAIDEHEAPLGEADESHDERQEIDETIDHECGLIVQDYVHRSVSEKIIR